MKTTLEKQSAMGVSPMRSDSRLIRGRGRKRGSLLMTKEFWRALTSASLPHGPTLRRLHD